MLGRHFQTPRRIVRNCSFRKHASVLIANRGEIAIRIAQAAGEAGLQSVGICSQDDNTSLHCRRVDNLATLTGFGPRAYLDQSQIVAIAKANDCAYLHPGYGFLSENADFAKLCAQNGIKFIGPTFEHLRTFGDKSRARIVASECGIPVIPGTNCDTTVAHAQEFYRNLPPHAKMIIKARSGGGGRGMRIVSRFDDIPSLMERCKSEAKIAFGDDCLYVEMFIPQARHIEVQIIGDGKDIAHLWERDCSLQRNHQKIVEIAPSPTLSALMRSKIINSALTLAKNVNYLGLGTFEFLVYSSDNGPGFYFMEANPRLQVEHTVTEALCGVDLVRMQFGLAAGETIRSLGLLNNSNGDAHPPAGYAMQCRVNMETQIGDTFKPTGGVISVFEPPCGKGVRVDACAYSGYHTSTRYDALLAKVVTHSPSRIYADCVKKMVNSLGEFRLEGFDTNITFLLKLLAHPSVVANAVTTSFVDDFISQSISDDAKAATPYGIDSNTPLQKRYFETTSNHLPEKQQGSVSIDNFDVISDGLTIKSPMTGTIIAVEVSDGDVVVAGQQMVVLEAMKMEHVIVAQSNGVIRKVISSVGDAVREGNTLLSMEISDVDAVVSRSASQSLDLNYIRPDLQEVMDRLLLLEDVSRSESVIKRHKMHRRTARENLVDLVDEGSFVEYGGLTIAAQRRRRSFEDLIKNTPADGMVCGIGSVNAGLFSEKNQKYGPSDMPVRTSCVVLSYDYMVLAGTQGLQNHRKKDRMFELAENLRLPVILFAEGGGGRPGDTDTYNIAGLDCVAFALYAKLSGLVPRIGIASGRCFAGNAALLGASDVIIATPDANIGMAGPAMIEGGGLGSYKPEEIGPIATQLSNGVVDLLARDDSDAVRLAKKYVSYFQGDLNVWEVADQRELRNCIPENRLRIYDIRLILNIIVDKDSLLELRESFGRGMITALGRIQGKAVGIIANNPAFLSGAIDSDGADKISRFMQLCDAFEIPLISFCDTPGIMVGPDAEKSALVRHAARMFVTSASISVPLFTVVLRKGYGLGAQAMAGGSFKTPAFTISWPTGEFGGMGLEGAVRLGYKKELDAIADEQDRKNMFNQKVDELYQNGKAVNYATAFEIDGVVDPADTRRWIVSGLNAMPHSEKTSRPRKRRNFVDTW